MSDLENINTIIFGSKDTKQYINYFCDKSIVDQLDILFTIYNPENLDLLSELESRTIVRLFYKK